MRVIATNRSQPVASNIPMPTSDRDFTSTMRAHQPKLYRTACFLTGDHHEGEDLLQETLLEAWKSWNSFEDRSAVYLGLPYFNPPLSPLAASADTAADVFRLNRRAERIPNFY